MAIGHSYHCAIMIFYSPLGFAGDAVGVWQRSTQFSLASPVFAIPLTLRSLMAAVTLAITATMNQQHWLRGVFATLVIALAGCSTQQHESKRGSLILDDQTAQPRVVLDEVFYETTTGRVSVPAQITASHIGGGSLTMPDGRTVKIDLARDGSNVVVRLSAEPNAGIIKWGFAVNANANEYFTGLMERVVDGPQQASWKAGISPAMNLRGQKVDMILKPTTSVYAPFYLSSRGYAVFVKGNWPGHFDFCASDPQRVKIEFEGPSLETKFYTSADSATLVKAHALDAGPPFLPPKWTFTPWRWRDEHTQRPTYYDGTPVTGPFNSEFMEDVLMMRAYGIPCGVYWIDRPWGTGLWGYDDFEIDPQRLPNFGESVKWLREQQMQMVLWIGPFFQGEMLTNALAKGYTLAGQKRPTNGNNYPMVDFTNPDATKYWQDGVAKLLKLGVTGFKLDRAEEDIPENGPYKVFDGRTIRENRNAYPAMYLKATYDVAKQFHPDEDFALMPRAAYTGSSPYGVFWGGDIGGTQEGLRASIIAVQRSAVMGYPTWGSDTCGYNDQRMEQEVCARWLAFSCFTPIMEVGPTKNLAFWNMPREPKYDATLIAVWRLYARLHQRLADYTYDCAKEAHRSGLPIVRPLFLVEPNAPQAWSNWWTYQYGPNLLVSPVWKKEQRTQEVYLPSGSQWRDAWNPEKTYSGGQTITVQSELHHLPIFIRNGSKVELGDLTREWTESVNVAKTPPDLKALDAEVKAWFEKRRN
jgi:alpha-D-xyloside xylohydrolase